MSGDFSPEQKRYLEGFVSGLNAARATRGTLPGAASEPAGPDAIHLKAQDRVTAAGGKLVDQEKFKREQHPFDAYDRLKQQAEKNEPPKPADNFRWRYFGLFYVAPAQAPTCAGCASRTASSSTGSSRASPTSPSAAAVLMRM